MLRTSVSVGDQTTPEAGSGGARRPEQPPNTCDRVHVSGAGAAAGDKAQPKTNGRASGNGTPTRHSYAHRTRAQATPFPDRAHGIFLGGYAPKPPHSRASRSVSNRCAILGDAAHIILAIYGEINPPTLPEKTPRRYVSIDEKRKIFQKLLYKKFLWTLIIFGKKLTKIFLDVPTIFLYSSNVLCDCGPGGKPPGRRLIITVEPATKTGGAIHINTLTTLPFRVHASRQQ